MLRLQRPTLGRHPAVDPSRYQLYSRRIRHVAARGLYTLAPPSPFTRWNLDALLVSSTVKQQMGQL